MPQKLVDDKVKSLSERVNVEFETIKSDRVDLVSEANRLVGTLLMKEVVPQMADVPKEPLPQTPAEKAAYESALSFLKRQFDNGFRDSEVMTKKQEKETKKEKT